MSCSDCWSSVLVLKWCLAFSALVFCATGNFYSDMDVTWGDGRAVIMDNGQALRLSLDRPSGSGCQSRKEFLFGKFDVKMKLVEGNSAGTVTAFYLKSQGSAFDEVDMEFLGNLSGDPYILHTNVYTQGQGNREQQFYLWFDPTKDFHTYSILWNQHHVMIYADGTPIREFRNLESSGVRFPLKQPMRVYSSLWNADQWATRGGLIKTDWSQAPFSATLRDIVIDGCTRSPNGAPICGGHGASMAPTWMEEGLVVSPRDQKRLAWVKKNYMVSDYCKQLDRFPQGLPKECSYAL